ncbi:MAG TPA: hypothetical protein VJJ20_02250 [Candidatus Paceibacterota bacterium]
MSAEDLIKEIAPAVARRRIYRGVIWMLKKTCQYYLPQLWLANLKEYVPKDTTALGREHLLQVVFGKHSIGQAFSHWRKVRIVGKVRLQHVIEEFELTDQFLIAHGFRPDPIITADMLNYLWYEAVFERDYQAEWTHLRQHRQPKVAPSQKVSNLH